jgi:hypothetical protein
MCTTNGSRQGDIRMPLKSPTITSLLIVLFLTAGSVRGEEVITINLDVAECPWADSRLGEKLNFYLSSIDHAFVRQYRRHNDSLNGGVAIFDSAGVLDSSRVAKERLFVDIHVDRVGLEKRKSTIIPELIFRYRVYAILTGTLRIYDFRKDRLIEMKEITYEIKAADRWQVVDDDANDSELMMAPDDKLVLFGKLEDKAARDIFREIRTLAQKSGRNQ